MRLKVLALFALPLIFALVWLFFRGVDADRQVVNQGFSPIPAQFEDRSLFLSPIKQLQDEPSENLVTGLTVPHHLLAADLIAKAFNFASSGRYSQILVLSPDHFNLGDANFSTTERDLSTVFGTLRTDVEAVKQLEKLPLVRNQDFFYREHGIGAELPFIKYYFPDAKIIVLVIKETTPKDQLQQVVGELKQALKPDSLIIQSTDFSHYLNPAEANIYDQQTLKVLKDGNPEGLFALSQPANLDSIASQYIQLRLQNEFFGSQFHLLYHKNSQNYTKEKIDSSTSYIVQAYFRD